ncbi:related to P.glauca late embryogenesis abundant protein and YBR177c and YPL095c [Cephalotrichum gorgonifer]|uniref:alcohol O-acetyltransferase n=1 Tax=Cephalotrichum gorgonifer TaxID=2041049 RepID=A0AAE8MQM6_9PEZI|nr:related to P.glauca late embryogenesis abundant protein and YBR177c and YPL095c [Cephalotrichum gorgonifer]
MAAVAREVTPPCHLNPLLFNGHVQTMWTATKQEGPTVHYKRKVFDSDNKTCPGTYSVDFVEEPFEESDSTLPPHTVFYNDSELAGLGSDDTRPQLVVLHGLSGGSHEIYLRHAIAPLVESGDWEICVVNSRGCAMSPITSGVLYNARATWDIRQTVKWLRKKFPNRPLYGLGFSLGANILTNYCGEEGLDCQLKAAIVCSNPFNLEVSNKALRRTLLGKEVYQRVMGNSMKELAKRHKVAIETHTCLDYERLASITYLYEFDRELQCPLWGYPTEDAYYRDASSTDAVLAIRIPFLAVHAVDDPIAVDEAVPYREFEANPYTAIVATSLGGHLCWFELGGGRWFAKPVCNFLNKMQFEIDGVGDGAPSEKKSVDGRAQSPYPTGYQGANFQPMRRKMHISHD